jgi:hypothetical protein
MHNEHHAPLTHFEKEVIMRLSELLSINVSIAGQLSKIETEILAAADRLRAQVADLTAQLADAPLSEAQTNSVNDVVAAVERLDAIVPDPVVDPIDPPVEV